GGRGGVGGPGAGGGVGGGGGVRPAVCDAAARDVAHRLSLQIDTLIAYGPTCETAARATPKKAAQDLAARITAFEGALKDFRIAIGVLKPTDTVKTPARQ